jgi:hypothetical protein
MTDKRTIVLDLSKHLDQKFKQAIEDFVDLCGRTDIDETDMLMQVITVASHYTALAAIEARAGEREYLAVCQYQYRKGRQCQTQTEASQ